MTAWWFVTLVLNALALGAPLGHALEMPGRCKSGDSRRSLGPRSDGS